jgi:uncharacterized protein DUF1570
MKRFLLLSALLIAGSAICHAKHAAWVEVRSAHFIVVTDAGEKKGRSTAEQFEQIQNFFRQSLAIGTNQPIPFVKILAAENEHTMREVLPPGFWSPGHARLAGEFIHHDDKYFALVELDTQRSGYFPVLYHEYYHAVTTPTFPNLPLWLAEGLADFYGFTEIKEASIETGVPDRERLDVLRTHKLLPLNVLFKVDHGSPYYNESEKTSIFYAESWLLTHYLMIGNPEAHKLLIKYLQALNQRKNWNEASAAFGDLNKLQSDLKAYVRQKKFLSVSSPLPVIDSSQIQVRELSQPEVKSYIDEFSALFFVH